tara:strand:+ start:150 stop:326 length:177 start_codon:yes stop_codon:yes gene_type:complete
MNRYKVKIEKTKIYECEINADGGYEAANKALECPSEWKLLEVNDKCIGSSLSKEGIRE